jgi:hypothetical protein
VGLANLPTVLAMHRRVYLGILHPPRLQLHPRLLQLPKLRLHVEAKLKAV